MNMDYLMLDLLPNILIIIVGVFWSLTKPVLSYQNAHVHTWVYL